MTTEAGYVISAARRRVAGYVTIEGVTDGLQRFSVTMKYENTTADVMHDTIMHALAARRRPPKPVR